MLRCPHSPSLSILLLLCLNSGMSKEGVRGRATFMCASVPWHMVNHLLLLLLHEGSFPLCRLSSIHSSKSRYDQIIYCEDRHITPPKPNLSECDLSYVKLPRYGRGNTDKGLNSLSREEGHTKHRKRENEPKWRRCDSENLYKTPSSRLRRTRHSLVLSHGTRRQAVNTLSTTYR